ncbi:DUF1963 domain-containing protein [Pedobacter cryoconitis]|uniref:Uncharacterized protein YwqG n=1 Tax=Pedobacter cryoconitis TaxID=188932 RepID=A0A7X0J372_9SPHI|nr:YwqG family protein [Pedobacter cryoconitis]MBB6500260.1 uncharacterized protein YwqG [Pedobacter cryoconitis]
MDSHFDKYRQELDKENLTTFEDLENLIRPLIRTATEIEVSKPSKPKANTQLLSHFGGQPYFEEGEEWPKTKKGKNLNFIFQIYNNGGINLPGNLKLVQFFYDWDEFPWETENDGWLVKTYTTLNTSQIIEHAQPAELETTKFCEVNFKSVQSLPDWEGIGTYSKNASNLSCVLDEDEPWGNYQKAVEKLIGEQEYRSQLGGYPMWVQGEDTPVKEGVPMKLLFQIDSEDNAGIMWGDVGLIYVFYNEASNLVEFTLQCH